MSFKFGKCVIVLKKIYVYIILFIFICFGIYINVKYYNSLSIQNLQNNEKKLHSQQFLENLGKNTGSELTWENLIDDCGANVMVVAKYLGHAKIDETLNTYTHLFNKDLEKVVNIFNEEVKLQLNYA